MGNEKRDRCAELQARLEAAERRANTMRVMAHAYQESAAADGEKLCALVEAGAALVQHLEGDADRCRQCGALHPTAHHQACPVGNLAAALRGEL